MTTVLHSANITNFGKYARANASITYERPGDLSSYRVNMDLDYTKDLPSFGVRASHFFETLKFKVYTL